LLRKIKLLGVSYMNLMPLDQQHFGFVVLFHVNRLHLEIKRIGLLRCEAI
jgi:hypothetical protein